METENMTLDELKTINLAKAKHQLVTLPLFWLAVIFIAGWLAKPWIADAFGFVTVANAEQQATAVKELGDKFDDHIVEFRVTAAFQIESGLRKTKSYKLESFSGKNY